MKTISRFLIEMEAVLVFFPLVLFIIITFIFLSIQTFSPHALIERTYFEVGFEFFWILWFGGCLGVKSLFMMMQIISFEKVEYQKKRYILLSGISGVTALLTPIILNFLTRYTFKS